MSSYLEEKYPPGNEHIPSQPMIFLPRRWDIVNGRNPAPVEVGRLSHYLQGSIYIPAGCLGYLPSTVGFLEGIPTHQRTSVPCTDRSWSKSCRRRSCLRIHIERMNMVKGSGKDVWGGFFFLFVWQVDVTTGSGIDLGERYLDGIQVRLEWFGRFLADLAHTWNWSKWTRFFQKHLHPSAASNALARGFMSILLEGAVASEDPQMLPDVFIDFGEPFLVGCFS